MKNINNLTLSNLYWLRDKGIPTSKLRINQENLDVVVRAKCLVLGIEYSPIACFSCSARAEFKVAQSILDQYGQVIYDRITELEAIELSQPLDVVDKDGEQYFVVANSTQEYNEFNDIDGDVMVEKIVSSEYDSESQTLSETTVKRGRKKNEE
jgi:hypothetical protein